MLGSYQLLDKINIDGHGIRIVRDDLFPFIGGGGKARKAVEYEAMLRNQGYDAVVTCGGVQSNHNRAIALMAARNGWRCHLCIQGPKERFYSENGNALLDRLSGAECEFIRPEETAQAMDNAIQKFRDQGFHPYYIHGGGHDLPGGVAFVKAVKALHEQCVSEGYKPSVICHASGTGSTQAGILVGLELVGWSDVKVVGISVARQQARGRQVVVDFANELARYYDLDVDFADRVIFNADYLLGGYEKYNDDMRSFLRDVMKRTGIMFDTTYSGKALYGMMNMLRKGEVEGNILFWHTGGLMNLMK